VQASTTTEATSTYDKRTLRYNLVSMFNLKAVHVFRFRLVWLKGAWEAVDEFVREQVKAPSKKMKTV